MLAGDTVDRESFNHDGYNRRAIRRLMMAKHAGDF